MIIREIDLEHTDVTLILDKTQIKIVGDGVTICIEDIDEFETAIKMLLKSRRTLL